MKKVLLIYPPFCTPASPPYSITYLHAFLKDNLKDVSLSVIDLNLLFHELEYPKTKSFFKSFNVNFDSGHYEEISSEYRRVTSKAYSDNNGLVVEGNNPGRFQELLSKITKASPDVVGFSIVYSSQVFYAYALIKELKKLNIKTIVGGPAVNDKLRSVADAALKNEVELLEYLSEKKPDYPNINCNTILDYSIFDLNGYFTPYPVIPLKTCSTCYYQRCTFCTHHNNSSYFEIPLENIKNTIIKSGQKHFFLIDDMIHKNRLLEIANMVKPLGISWACQLRPTKELDKDTLKILYDSGLKTIMWGVESGSNRILDLINKGTNRADIEKVLVESSVVGIKNIVYIIFGFPTETKEEFLQTISLLKENANYIVLISTSIFGLQKVTKIYESPELFGISKIIEEQRTVLEPKISYEVSVGLSQESAARLRGKYKRTIDNINKYPKTMNFFREHMLCLI